MKIRVLIGLLALSLVFSCKQKSEVEEKATQDTTTETAAPAVTSIQLANYSDENWKNGVGTIHNMLLVDFSQEKMDLISKGTELYLENGQKLKYIGSEKVNNYIHILFGEYKLTPHQSALEYPNNITVK